jgi:hypothetical protein
MLARVWEQVNQAKRQKISMDYCEQPDSGGTISAEVRLRGI